MLTTLFARFDRQNFFYHFESWSHAVVVHRMQFRVDHRHDCMQFNINCHKRRFRIDFVKIYSNRDISKWIDLSNSLCVIRSAQNASHSLWHIVYFHDSTTSFISFRRFSSFIVFSFSSFSRYLKFFWRQFFLDFFLFNKRSELS